MPYSVGINRVTGKPLTDWDHVVQSIGTVLSTRIGTRVMREYLGFQGLSLLGQTAIEERILRMFQLTSMALSIRLPNGKMPEPRFRVVRYTNFDLTRLGNMEFHMIGQSMPRGHLGDFTVEGQRGIIVGREGDAFRTRPV